MRAPVVRDGRARRAACALALLGLSGCGASAVAPGGTPSTAATAAGVVMVAVPGGWFEMGSDDRSETDQMRHRVLVSAFLIDKHPVTQEEYERLMGVNPSHWRGPKRPVEQIRWHEAAAYCNARSREEGLRPAYDPKTWASDFTADGYRLPTEAEFEYALRAGTTTEFFFGDSPQDLKHYAWYKGNSPRGTHLVGEKPANAWGLHDMIGNVWQWCNDYYAEDYYEYSPAQDPTGPTGGENRVIRGGCWNSKPDDCRSAYRYFEMPAYTDICFAKDVHGQVGFRCVRRRE